MRNLAGHKNIPHLKNNQLLNNLYITKKIVNILLGYPLFVIIVGKWRRID